MIPTLLALLAIVDVAFAGFRAAAGRDAHIDKRAYYRRAMASGALAGVGLVAALSAITVVLLLASGEAAALYAELLTIGARMLVILLGYALLVLGALALYAAPQLTLRVLATVTILGPFTLLRPLAIVAATVWGVYPSRSAPAVALTIGSSAAVLALGRLLDWQRGRARG